MLRADVCDAAATLARVLRDTLAPSELERRRAWAAEWRRADERYYALLDDQLNSERAGPLTEAVAVRAVVDAAPGGSWLALGNSLPVRDVDAFVPPRSANVAVLSQRGLSGIDGLVAGALGAASISQASGLALMGDVTFLHDVSALALASEVTSSLGIVVLDNGGGRIFETLPVARLLAEHPERAKFWLTPHDFDLSHAAALYRIPYFRVEDEAALERALRAALERKGCTLIHAVVLPDSCRVTLGKVQRALTAQLSLD